MAIMETLTITQAYDVMLRWLKPHPWHEWTVGMLLDAADHLGVLDQSGEPASFDPAEWPDFKRAALSVLAEQSDK
jgi:hypothetical protein